MTLFIQLFSSIFDAAATTDLLISYAVHLLVLIVLVFGIYYTTYRRKNFVFTFFLIGSIVFFLSYVMSKLELNMGFGLGLFAIFGIIRYRTDLVPIREMTYLFIIIGLSVLNGLTKNTMSFSEAAILNGITLITILIFEKALNLRTESFKIIVYERLDLLVAGNEDELKLDVRTRTNIPVDRIEVLKYNFTKNSVLLKVYYHSKKPDNGGGSDGLITDDGDDD
jgi:hypothetical protein